MSARAELTDALSRHPGGAVHLEHGQTTLDAGGCPARRGENAGQAGHASRWDYAAARMAAWCGCGWTGEPHAQQKAVGAGTGASRYDEWRRLNRSTLATMEREWEGHVDEALPTLPVYEAQIVLARADRALRHAVEDARRRGASWAELGAATGVGKKVAHARWGGSKDILLPRELSKGGRPRKLRPEPEDPGDVAVSAAAGVPAAQHPGADMSSAPASTTAPAAGTTGTRRGPESGAQPGAGRRGRSGRGRDTGQQVRELVRALSQRHGLEVEATWQGTRSRDGRRGGWSIEWRGGPTRADLRADAVLVVEEDPRLAGLDVRELSWFVGRTDADQAALVLEWLRTHPGEGERVRHLDEGELPGWPEHLPDQLRAHAATLAAAGWGYQRGGTAADTLHARAAAGGYDAVAAWLTELAARRDAHRDAVQDGTVVDLATHRTP